MNKSNNKISVEFSRVIDLPAAVAIGLCISFSATVLLVLNRFVEVAGSDLVSMYLIGTILYIPIILTYVEQAARTSGGGNAYQIARTGRSSLRTFLVGWLMLGSYFALAGFLTWGVAYRLEIIFKLLEGFSPSLAWLAVGVLILAVMIQALDTNQSWSFKKWFVLGGIFLLLLFIVLIFFSPKTTAAKLSMLDPYGHWLATISLMAAGLWGINEILGCSAQIQRPEKYILLSTLISWGLTGVIGVLGVYLFLSFPNIRIKEWLSLSWEEDRLKLLTISIATAVCFVALSRILTSLTRHIREMAGDGFLPLGKIDNQKSFFIAALIIFLSLTAVFVLAVFARPRRMASLAAFGFLWATALVFITTLAKPADADSEESLIRLPWHPLFPSYTICSCLFLSLLLPYQGLTNGIGWILIGGLYFLVYGSRGRVGISQEEVVVGKRSKGAKKTGFRILISVDDQRRFDTLLQIGIAMAKANDGEVLALRVVPHSERAPTDSYQHEAARIWEDLEQRLLKKADTTGVPLNPLVRIAPDRASGILETASEYTVDFILVSELPEEEILKNDEEYTARRIFPVTSRPLAVLIGSPSEIIKNVIITAGGPNAKTALDVGTAVSDKEGSITLIRAATGTSSIEAEKESLLKTLTGTAENLAIEQKIVSEGNIKQGILRESERYDLLLMGASVDPVLGQSVAEGLPLEVAEARPGATLIIKAAEKARSYWSRRVWNTFYNIFPTLTSRERSEVFLSMRHAARAEIDFYVLMSLASLIATLGLLLNSGAVIIGAMLVAPLMSPLLSIGHGLVLGNMYMIRRGTASTMRGIGVALVVSIGISLVFKSFTPTTEILARSKPQFLDLVVACAAGVAAAYGACRHSVAAALPGVAIAVSLVPPLCVVGYGIGTSEFLIAGGALLLFITNICAIIVIGALTFFLLGFSARRSERGNFVKRGMILALTSILILAVPLGFSTSMVAEKSRIATKILNSFQDKLLKQYRLRELNITLEGDEYVLDGIVYASGPLGAKELMQYKDHLEEILKVPIRIKVTVIRVEQAEVGRDTVIDALTSAPKE